MLDPAHWAVPTDLNRLLGIIKLARTLGVNLIIKHLSSALAIAPDALKSLKTGALQKKIRDRLRCVHLPCSVKDWLNWTIYFGCFELCNLWYSTLLSCVTVVISLYKGPPCARPNIFGVLACGFFVSFVFSWVYIFWFHVPSECVCCYLLMLCSASVTFGGSGAWNHSSSVDRLPSVSHT